MILRSNVNVWLIVPTRIITNSFKLYSCLLHSSALSYAHVGGSKNRQQHSEGSVHKGSYVLVLERESAEKGYHEEQGTLMDVVHPKKKQHNCYVRSYYKL